jgi:DNA (cytosine-5)-methyltransferase 1
MTAYYNEIDPAAAQWLRNLIDAGHIAPGIVDERSIEDVYPSDLRGFTQCHFFAGIGVWSYALRQAGWPDDRPVWTGSCPCQPFSAAGKGAGFDDERHLWPAFHHLIKECAPAIVIGEQVASKDSDPWIDLVHTDLEALGYAFGAIPFPSASVGAPHIRDRLYWVADTERKQRRPISFCGHSKIVQSDAAKPTAEFTRDSCIGGLAHHHGDGRQPGSEGGEAMGHGQAAGADCGFGGVEHAGQNDDASQVNAASVGESQANRPANQLGRSGFSLGGLEHTLQLGRQRGKTPASGHDDDGPAPERAQGEHGLGRPGEHRFLEDAAGPTNGFWRAADWLLCRDGKWRPVEPSTFPLAHGATARVVRLRAYGNAINAKAAQAFIESLT